MPPIRLDSIVLLLSASPLLDLLPEAEIRELAIRIRQLHFDAGEIVFAQNTPGAHVYWVAKGRLRLTASSKRGGEILHSMTEVGDYCGEITAIDGGLRGVNAIADCETDTISLNRRYLLPAIERHPEAAMKLARLLCLQIRIAGATIENLALHGAERRIWSKLLQLSRQYARVDRTDGSLRIMHGLSQQHLANSVGLTRVMVNRQLRVWRDQGLTEDGRGFVLILDPEAFEAFVWRESVSGGS